MVDVDQTSSLSEDIRHDETVGGTAGNPHALSAALSDTTDVVTETFTSSGTWEKPEGALAVTVHIVAAGDGGDDAGGVQTNGFVPGGGGSGRGNGARGEVTVWTVVQ